MTAIGRLPQFDQVVAFGGTSKDLSVGRLLVRTENVPLICPIENRPVHTGIPG